MRDKIVPLPTRPRSIAPTPAHDGWHDQINRRLAGIEHLIRRLEWQVWGVACGAAGLLLLDTLHRLTGR